MFAHFGAKRYRACRRCWALALQNAVNTAKNCCAERWAVVLSVLLLLWLARALRGPCLFPVGFRAFWRARARPQPCVVAFAFPGWLAGCSFGLLFLGPLAPARATPCQPSGFGPGWGPESCPASSGVGVGRIRFSYNKNKMTWYNFKEA